MFTSVCSRCGITNIGGYVKRAHFIHDSITLTSCEFDQITLRQSRSAGARWSYAFVSAFPICGLCHLMKPILMPTGVHLAFQYRLLAVPVCLFLSQIQWNMLNKTGRCTSQHFVLDSNGLRHQKICLVSADGTEIAFPTVLFFLVTQESWHVYKFFIKSSRERKVLLRSIKVSRVEAVNGTGKWTAGKYIKKNIVQLSGLKCDSVEVKVSMRRNSTLRGVRESIEVRRVVLNYENSKIFEKIPEGMPWA
ncbi:hypothetical protein Tsp_02680 [Trichinella spiralis]|uniref:hypothetical protein n=1 Tax=Trichinella spiralis TaxID=6334 RepID=UPI0001EFBDC4|nr:hypothetical protein Tsp_02680 [Trichinella spiralis]